MRSTCGRMRQRLSRPEDAEVAGKFRAMLRAPGTRVEGAPTRIMRNIVPNACFLPGDIRVDKDVPFNKIPTKGRT